MVWSSTVLAHTFVALRLPSGSHKILKIIPNTSISLGKYGSFPSNQLIGRPFYLTFEIVDGDGDGDDDGAETSPQLRVVPPEEIHIEALAEDSRGAAQSDLRDDIASEEDAADSFDVIGSDGELLIRNNRLTIDDPARQALTMEEIEALKKTAPGSGKDIIAKIMQSHSALDEKTAFSLAKYTLRKSKKYLRRFTLLPLDVSTLTSWMLYEKEPVRVLEIREEMLGLLCSWANIRHSPSLPQDGAAGARWLVIDDTGGLIVAALAERMGTLYPTQHHEQDEERETDNAEISNSNAANENGEYTESLDGPGGNADTENNEDLPTDDKNSSGFFPQRRRQKRHAADAMSASSNSITLIHSANQPNISLLAYFGYNPTETSIAEPYPAFKHPLHTHLKTLSWLQLLSPESDGAYLEPEYIDPETLANLKTSKRGNYYRKRRRWECTKRVVDETRQGNFDGLVVASSMEPTSILHHTVPLLSGGAPVVVYSPYAEPLAELMDIYSSSRRAAYISQSKENAAEATCPSEDFPADPRLLLGASLQTARATEWQVLPGRTHPLMTGRGGAEGYLFTATRVLPIDGVVEARGRFSKKRKTAAPETDANGV